MAGAAQEYDYSVFINCPFDAAFLPLMNAMIFAIHDCGFWSRCAKEGRDSSVVRFEKILKFIEECRFGIHDLSRTQVDGKSLLPRFNMPFELGLFLAAKAFGGKIHERKVCLILDAKKHQYQKTLSDIAGQDPAYHGNRQSQVILKVRDWLNDEANGIILPGADLINKRFRRFSRELPVICKRYGINPTDLSYINYRTILAKWLLKHSSFTP